KLVEKKGREPCDQRATLIVILSVQFTKLIIHHLQRKHRFHPRPDSSLHLSNEEPVLGYLKFSDKGTKREIFGMPIPGRLITANVRAAPYYQEYQENVAKHRGFLAGETRSTQDLPAPRPAKLARKPQGSPKSVGTSEAEEVPAEEPQVADEDVDFQKAVEESMKDAYALPRGPLPPVVIREPELGKYQPLPEVPGKGKAKVSKEQVSHDLLSLQKHKKTSPADQYIFQRRVSKPTAYSFNDVSPYEVLGQSNSEEETEKVVLGVEKDTGAQAEGQAGSNPDESSEGQAGSNPDETSKGQVGTDPGNAEARSNYTKVFTATIYPNVQENLKLAVEEPVLLEEPASSSGTLSSLQHLSRDFTFGDQFFSDKPSDADKSIETKVESMVNVPIQQAMSSISLMTSPIIDLTSRPESPKEHPQLKATTTDTTTTTTTTLPPPQAPQQRMKEAMMVKRIGELEHTLADLIQVNKTIKERLDKHRARLYTLEQLDIPQQVSIAEIDSYKSHEDHMHLFEALEKSINRDQSEELAHDLAEARKKRKKGHESPKTAPGSPSHQPPPPPPPAGPSGTSRAPRASGSQVTPPPPPPTSTNQDSLSTGSAVPSPIKTAATTKHQAWLTPDITLKPLVSLTPEDLDMDEAMGPDEQAQLSDEEDIRSAHIPTVNLRQCLWKPFEERMTYHSGTCLTRYSRRPVTLPPLLTGSASDEELLSLNLKTWKDQLMRYVDDPILRHNVRKPLPLGGPPGQVTIQSDFFFNKDLEYLRYGSKGRRPALSISKMKAAYYPDAGLEQMVPDYTVRTHMRIVSVVRIKVFSMYGYDYMKKIVLRRADLNEHVIAERDFKYLYPSDFKDLNLLNLQGHLNYLPPKDKKILTMAVNQWTRQLVIRPRVEDFQLGIESYQTQDYRVKEFRINRMNPGLNTRFWTRKDVDRCKAFMFTIQRRLRTRRILRNLESFVGGCVRKGDYRLLKRTD
nr:histone deacetylase 14 [Tanacetum cinerariifolium]